ncbi:hypothetical protein FRC04_008612 [Tulasnella sp. 424]|nr:hypothetical protein FRC04_008612 [Tulasnella sp. 424]
MFDDSKAPCYALVPFQRVVGVEPATLEMTARPQDRSTIERVRISRRLYGHSLKAAFLSHPLSRPSSTVMRISAITDLTLHGTCPYTWSRATSSSATPFHTVSHVEPKTQVGLAQSMNLNDASNMDQSEEEEIEDSGTEDAASIPLPPSRPTSPEAEEVNATVGEEFLQADLIPLPESRPESPEVHGPDPSTRSLDMYQYIAALTHQYLSLRATLSQPILPEESRAIRAELRPRLSGLRERALIRHGLGSPAPVEAELEVQQEEVVVEEEEVQEEGQEEQEEQDEEEPGDDLEIDPSAENQDVGNVEGASRRPFRLKTPIAVIRHISTNTM